MQELSDNELAVAKAYVGNGFNKTQAWKSTHPKAGTNSAAVNGYKTINKPHVQKAIQELTDKQLSPIKDSKEAIINEAVEITQEARAQKQYSAAIKGLDTRAKLGGFYDQDGEDSQKYFTFIQNLQSNNLNITVNKNDDNVITENNTRLVSEVSNQDESLGDVSTLDSSKVIDIDNTYDDDRDNEYTDDSIGNVG